ncbi:MAG TPA: GDSL-type esterase/lipase family protein [Terracidiphilus sp.]
MTATAKVRYSSLAALLPAAAIILLLALKVFANQLYSTSIGRFPAMMVEVMRSRTLLYFWSPSGYYEDLFNSNRTSREQILFGSTTFVRDAFRLRRLRPNLTNVTDWKATDTPVNQFGYIGPDWSITKPLDTRRVAVLGDSVPEGYGVNMNQGFVYLLANRLNEAPASQPSPQFEVLNFSVSGYELTQMMDVAARDTPQFHPDVYMVILTELSVHRGWDSHLVYLIKSGIDLRYDFLRDVVRRADARQTDSEAVLSAKLAPYRMEIIRKSLLEMKQTADQHGAQFIIVLAPTLEDADIARRRFAGIPELLSSMNVGFIDLSDIFMPMLDRESVRQSRTDVHPNIAGHRMICDALFAQLHANHDLWTQLTGVASSRFPDASPSQ